MLNSVGKESAVMLHIEKIAFYPSKGHFPLMHVDTTWKFQEMYKFRHKTATQAGITLIVSQNPEEKKKGINPFRNSALYKDLWKAEVIRNRFISVSLMSLLEVLITMKKPLSFSLKIVSNNSV